MTARRRSSLLATLLGLALVFSLGSYAPVVAAPTQVSTKTPTLRAALADKPKKPKFHIRKGVVFNNPLGPGPVRYRALNKIQAAINHTPGDGKIKIMSWNIMSYSAVTALLRAQARGVKIRVIMDANNIEPEGLTNYSWRRLKAGFKHGNLTRKPNGRSYAKACYQSCRGKGGQAHAKYYLFSKTGDAKRVLIQGSANLTAAAAGNQWNDVYTWVDNKKLYRFTSTVFDQMWEDQELPKAVQYVGAETKSGSLFFSPLRGDNFVIDPVQNILNNTSCQGAVDAGANGRTVIRFAPDVMRNERGMRAAIRLRQLYDAGCDVKIGYTVMGYDIYRFLNRNVGRGPVPIRHLVQDFDGDGEFDNYFHLKALSVNGVVFGNPTAYYVVNGSSNTSGNASFSDENIGVVPKKGITMAYQRYIDYWYNNFPHSATPSARTRALIKQGKIDPYAHVDMD